MDIQQSPMRELALFAGAGGGILGGKLLGWRTVCAVEYEPYARDVLVARQNDGSLEPFPIWDDVRTFNGKPWRGAVDVVSGGFPCQDISSAGKGAGLDGARSGLWREMARIIDEVRPRYVFVENSPMLTSRGLGVVLGDLAAMGFDARWGVLGADDAGAPHRRKRIWIVASNPDRLRGREAEERVSGGCYPPEPGHDGEAQYVANARGGRRGEQGQGQGQQQGRAEVVGAGSVRHPDRNSEPDVPVDAEVAGVSCDVADADKGRLKRTVPSEKGKPDADASSRSSDDGWRTSKSLLC
jgi:site-specific DNA-cytosine methylase